MKFLRNPRVFFGREAPDKEPLSAATIDSWIQAAEARPSGVTPTIYDLLAICEKARTTHPFKAGAIIRNLRWLMKMSTRLSGQSWDHPWENSR